MNLNPKKILLFCFCRHFKPSARLIHTTRWHPQKSYYEILKLSRTCSAKEIRDAYLNLCKEFHPDRNSPNSSYHVRFVEINEAYSVLSKPEIRSSYDASLISKTGFGSGRTNPQSHTVHDVGDCTSHESFGHYYYGTNWEGHKPSKKPKVSTVRFAQFLLLFSVLGGVIQFFIIRWLYRNSYKKEVEKYKLSPAALIALKQFNERLAQEKAIRSMRYKIKKSAKEGSEK